MNINPLEKRVYITKIYIDKKLTDMVPSKRYAPPIYDGITELTWWED